MAKGIFYIIFITSIFFDESKDNEEKFSFSEKSPLDFLDFLYQNNQLRWYTVSSYEIPDGWVKPSHIKELYYRTKSKRLITPVLNSEVSVSSHPNDKFMRRTEGYEALLILASYKDKTSYPFHIRPLLVSNKKIQYPPQKLKHEIKKWYKSVFE